MKSKLILLLLTVTYCNYSYSQPTVVDNTDVQVTTSSNDHTEVTISINKINPANLILSFNNTNSSGTGGQGEFYSLGSGASGTWYGTDLIPHSFCDPTTAFDASGTGYLGGLETSQTGYWIETTSTGGASYGPMVSAASMAPAEDKEMAYTVDELYTSPYANYFYCAWTDFSGGTSVVVNRSTDGGVTFSTPITLFSGWGQGTTVATGPEGEVYVAWAQYPGSLPAHAIGFSKSLDGGVTYATSTAFPITGIRTTSGGVAAFGGTRVNDFPSMAVDKSCGQNRGRIYIVWASFDPAVPGESFIKESHSSDQGASWSPAQIIDIQFKVDGTGSVQQAWMPSVSVDDITGMVAVAYYKMEAFSLNTWTYMSYSYDGGGSYSHYVKVSDVSHIPAPVPGPWASGYCGDYIGCTSFGGETYVAWMDNRSANWQIYVSKEDWLSTPILLSSPSSILIDAPAYIVNDITYQACNEIKVSDVNPVTFCESGYTTHATLMAGNDIILLPGTPGPGCSAIPASTNDFFLAEITPCRDCSTPGTQYNRGNPSPFANNTDKGSIESASGNYEVYAYPVPATNIITIGCYNNTKAHNISIVDIYGRVLIKVPITIYNGTEIRSSIDISALTPGNYIYKIDFDDAPYNGKFIKF